VLCPDFHQSKWIFERNHGNEWLGNNEKRPKNQQWVSRRAGKEFFLSEVADYAN
jgi:hypothetical protein